MSTRITKCRLSLYICALLFSSSACSDKHTPTLPEDPDKPEEEIISPEIENFKSNRILIKHGLQLQCWLASDNFEEAGKLGQPAYVMNPSDWELTGFTAPTFFGPPLINPSFFKHFPSSQWAMAKAPYGDHLKKGPTDYEKKNGFLKADHKAHLSNLVTMCFGDEEAYSNAVLNYLTAWYKVARHHYPDVLIHNNQYPGQWTKSDLRKYIKTAKPDLLTYDWYYFLTSDPDNYIGAKDIASHLMDYRELALEGIDGDHKNYIAFGQYIQGYVNQGTYRITESQLRLYYFMTLTFGGKWLNWFRYLQGNGYSGKTEPTEWSLLFEQGIPGKPTIHMKWANQCNKECMYLSDYLVRLKTKEVGFVSGSSALTEGCPNNMHSLNRKKTCIKDISGCLIEGSSETDKRGDLYVGTFEVIPEEEQGDPKFFKNDESSFFMITNGLASKLEQEAEPLAQNVTLTIDMADAKSKKLYWINMNTGKKEVLETIKEEENLYTYKFKINGGSGTLFIVE